MRTYSSAWKNVKAHSAGAVLLLLSACASVPAGLLNQSDSVVQGSQPPNVGDAGRAALAYHDSGAYERDLAAVAGEAKAWIASQADKVDRPALVADIDETVLSNWEIIKLDDFGRPIRGPCNLRSGAPCGWAAWDQLGRDPPIKPTLELFRLARKSGITVFFITGRPESQRAATERNLATAGFRGYAKLYMVRDGSHFASAADFKAPIRSQIEAMGYTIIANIGDQPSDLAGGHAQKTFLLPDPFYRVP
ncbi:MAG: HAD family acid phosphatase [Acidobacteriaceae bacterium]|nr:HAD family acid phosphatase [Acidobacteriaceae bacterium]